MDLEENFVEEQNLFCFIEKVMVSLTQSHLFNYLLRFVMDKGICLSPGSMLSYTTKLRC